eukprot:scaffold111361_cov19-Prasinocladus_malaysianus.AAC.1
MNGDWFIWRGKNNTAIKLAQKKNSTYLKFEPALLSLCRADCLPPALIGPIQHAGRGSETGKALQFKLYAPIIG